VSSQIVLFCSSHFLLRSSKTSAPSKFASEGTVLAAAPAKIRFSFEFPV
jgi:hypothetical protein